MLLGAKFQSKCRIWFLDVLLRVWVYEPELRARSWIRGTPGGLSVLGLCARPRLWMGSCGWCGWGGGRSGCGQWVGGQPRLEALLVYSFGVLGAAAIYLKGSGVKAATNESKGRMWSDRHLRKMALAARVAWE